MSIFSTQQIFSAVLLAAAKSSLTYLTAKTTKRWLRLSQRWLT